MNRIIFREYDIRGKYKEDFNDEDAYIIGKSYGSYIREIYNQTTCVVGHDNRLSSNSISKSLIKGINDSGCNVIDYGLVTTPMHYYTRKINKLFGIMVTASHNPKEDNGFKFSFDLIANARGKMIHDFTKYTFNGKFLSGNGRLDTKNIQDEYINYMKKNITMGTKKLKVVIDPGNGTTSIIVKQIHSLFNNLDITYINDESDGTFPNHHPDPAVEKNLAQLKETVLKTNSDIGLSYDGDGDRIGVIDSFGKYIPADKYMIIIIKKLFNEFNNKKILFDVKCSKALEDEIISLGGTPLLYRTGASFTEAGVIENNLCFGGEFSGHIFFNDRDTEIGSGIYAGLRLLEILSKTKENIDDILKNINKYYSSPEIKIPVNENIKFEVVNKIKEYCRIKNYNIIDIDGVRIDFVDGFALIRASNTGPNLTLRFEANDEKRLNEITMEFQTLTKKYLEA